MASLVAAACGGASNSDFFESGSSGSSGSTQHSSGGDPTPAPTGTSTTSPTPTSTNEPCTPITWYRDKDGDGFGGAETQQSCTSPGKNWVQKGGDCADDVPEAFPGQSAYFPEGYSKGSTKSFDFDCSGKEDQKPPVRKAATTCAVSVVGASVSCTGDGYVPVPRSGSGVDTLCGSTQVQTCKLRGGPGNPVCDSVISTAESPTACH